VDEAELEAMLDHDERHWWYRGRRRIVCDVVARLGVPPDARVLDAGCGSGRMLDELARSFAYVDGIELSEEGVALARGRAGGRADVRRGRVEELPWPEETFDLVLSLDVVEHTPDDRATLRELRRVTKPGGALLLTVPAYQALWSRHDVVNHHFRRYDRRMLRALAAETGWAIERMTSFNALLLGPAAAVRLAQRVRHGADGGGTAPASELALTPPRLSPLLELPLRAEAAWLRDGARSLPAGLSLLAVLRNASFEPGSTGVVGRFRPVWKEE
jgi:SAM-dependent methyltransferase